MKNIISKYQGLVSDIKSDARSCKCKNTKKMLKLYVEIHERIIQDYWEKKKLRGFTIDEM